MIPSGRNSRSLLILTSALTSHQLHPNYCWCLPKIRCLPKILMGENSQVSPSNAVQGLGTHAIAKIFLMSQPNHLVKIFLLFQSPMEKVLSSSLQQPLKSFHVWELSCFCLLLFPFINKPNYFMSSVSLITLASPSSIIAWNFKQMWWTETIENE